MEIKNQIQINKRTLYMQIRQAYLKDLTLEMYQMIIISQMVRMKQTLMVIIYLLNSKILIQWTILVMKMMMKCLDKDLMQECKWIFKT